MGREEVVRHSYPVRVVAPEEEELVMFVVEGDLAAVGVVVGFVGAVELVLAVVAAELAVALAPVVAAVEAQDFGGFVVAHFQS